MPAARVLAVAVLVVADPVRGHAERRAPAGPPVHGPGAHRQQPVPGGFGRRRHRAVLHDRRQAGVEGGLGGVFQHGPVGAARRPSLHHGLPASPGPGRGALPQQQDRGGDLAPALVVAERPPADAPTADEVHAGPVAHERRVRTLDRVEDPLVGELPGRAAQHRVERGQPRQQRHPVRALVGHERVLDERPVPVEPVAFPDRREHRRQRRDGQPRLAVVVVEHRAQQRHQAQVHPVRGGAVAGVAVQAALGHVVVDGLGQRRAPRPGQHGRVHQRLRHADLPVPPVARRVAARRVHVPPVVLHPDGDGLGQARVAETQRVRLRHHPQPPRRGHERRERRVGPERGGPGRHRGAVTRGRPAQRGQPGPVALGVVPRPRRHLPPAAAQQDERVVRRVRRPRRRQRPHRPGRGHAAQPEE